jgi:hypothetical protein
MATGPCHTGGLGHALLGACSGRDPADAQLPILSAEIDEQPRCALVFGTDIYGARGGRGGKGGRCPPKGT